MGDTLPDAALANIVRFLSWKPRSVKWQSFVAIYDVLSLLETEGHWAQLARNTFCTVEGNVRDALDRSKPGLRLENEEGRNAADLFRLVSLLGEGLTVLNFRKTRCNYPSAAAAGCLGLRHLALVLRDGYDRSHLPPLIVARGAGLEVLELDLMTFTEQSISAIGTHCRQLRRFRIATASADVSLAEMWKGIGPSLVELEFGALMKICYHNAFEKLAMFVAALESTILSRVAFEYANGFSCGGAIEELCSHCGPRLLEIDLRRSAIAPTDVLQRIAVACPNADILFDAGAETAVALGNSISSVVFENSVDDDVAEGIAKVGISCHNLKTVKISHSCLDLTEYQFRALFSRPKLQLKEFNFMSNFNSESTAPIWKVLGEEVQTLETLIMGGHSPPISLVEAFVNSNPRLREVRLMTKDPFCSCGCIEPSAALNVHVQMRLLSTFLRLPQLLELEISCTHPSRIPYEQIANACSPARLTRSTVSVCGYQYW